MSCLDKLTKLPKLDPFDSRLKAVSPSIISAASLKTRLYLAATALTSLKTEITTQITTQVGNVLGAMTGNSIIPTVAGIKSGFKQLSKLFTSAFTSAQATLKKQYASVSSLIQCEIDTTQGNSVVTLEANKIQSTINSISQTPLAAITNSSAKNLLESPAAKAAFIAAAVTSTISKGTSIIANSKSNKSIATNESQVITQLGSLA